MRLEKNDIECIFIGKINTHGALQARRDLTLTRQFFCLCPKMKAYIVRHDSGIPRYISHDLFLRTILGVVLTKFSYGLFAKHTCKCFTSSFGTIPPSIDIVERGLSKHLFETVSVVGLKLCCPPNDM